MHQQSGSDASVQQQMLLLLRSHMANHNVSARRARREDEGPMRAVRTVSKLLVRGRFLSLRAQRAETAGP